MDALAFLDRAADAVPQPVYVLAGDEAFLKRQVREVLDRLLLGEADADFAVTSYPGDTAVWSTVRTELDTLPFLAPRRVVVVDAADPFVTKYRLSLEKYVAEPAKSGTLILDVKAWPGNTKLAKAVPDAGTIVCKAPTQHQQLTAWCRARAKARDGKALAVDAAGWLVELVGTEMGVLDQELAKLAVFVGDAKAITREDVDRLVGRSRGADTFRIFDAIGGGRPAEALAILAQLFDQGEDPMKLLGAVSWQLRQLGAVNAYLRTGLSPAAAMDRASVPPFARHRVEAQLRHLGRRRLNQLYDWLLETDRGMKGSSQLSPRLLLERLVVKLARPRTTSGTV